MLLDGNFSWHRHDLSLELLHPKKVTLLGGLVADPMPLCSQGPQKDTSTLCCTCAGILPSFGRKTDVAEQSKL